MIYNFGVHLEFKAVEIDLFSPAAAAFAAVASQIEGIRLLTEQVATLTDNASRSRVDRERNNRDRPDNKYRNRDSNDGVGGGGAAADTFGDVVEDTQLLKKT